MCLAKEYAKIKRVSIHWGLLNCARGVNGGGIKYDDG